MLSKTPLFKQKKSSGLKFLFLISTFFLGGLNVLGMDSDDEARSSAEKRSATRRLTDAAASSASSAAKRQASDATAAAVSGQRNEEESMPSVLGAAAAAAASSGPASLERSESKHYAVATADTAFKHMLSLEDANNKEVVISFLNNFVPAFRGDPVRDVNAAPVALPALRREGEKQTFMDLHVVSSKGIHYIIEMQARRHVMFDERALFYACSTYARQLSESDLRNEDWYTKLCPVIALQILNYDTNRARGIESGVSDTFVDRVREHPLPEGEFVKHYTFKDKNSEQEIDHLQIVQVELPRSEGKRRLFPPQENFTPMEWWLSVLRHANEYTDALIESFYERKHMPETIYKALKRLNFTTWNAREQREYRESIDRRDLYATEYAVERAEGKKERNQEVARKLLEKSMPIDFIQSVTDLPREEIEQIKETMVRDQRDTA